MTGHPTLLEQPPSNVEHRPRNNALKKEPGVQAWHHCSDLVPQPSYERMDEFDGHAVYGSLKHPGGLTATSLRKRTI
ncbi:hypothetical protein MD484_g8943, partial [Candolleomyces efflorescens]